MFFLRGDSSNFAGGCPRQVVSLLLPVVRYMAVEIDVDERRKGTKSQEKLDAYGVQTMCRQGTFRQFSSKEDVQDFCWRRSSVFSAVRVAMFGPYCVSRLLAG